MAVEQTLAIIKPDSVKKGHIGNIIALYEQKGFVIKALKMAHLTEAQASAFYQVHASRPFFKDLVAFISSGPSVSLVLEREDAVLYHREVMGATNPKEAAEGTIRQLYGESIDYNAVHGSDSVENAGIEIEFFFPA
ncbi:nucleoside-diphosphate kinase [Gammaproteobacteria bacterium]|nr:nucleoside-diphosphate kinase [Gammaproteobacteria bacterium]